MDKGDWLQGNELPEHGGIVVIVESSLETRMIVGNNDKERRK